MINSPNSAYTHLLVVFGAQMNILYFYQNEIISCSLSGHNMLPPPPIYANHNYNILTMHADLFLNT